MGESQVPHTFTVEKYGKLGWLLHSSHLQWSLNTDTDTLSPVLPKFDVTIEAPDEVSVGDQSFKAQICSK